LKTVRIGPRPRMTGDRHSAVAPSSKAVRSSRDRGCNDHRILRRVPDDGRHPGSFERVPFTRGAGGGLGGSSVFRPAPNLVTDEDARQTCSSREDGRGGRCGRAATGVPEARSHTAPWEENAHADALTRNARVHSTCVVRRPAEAVFRRRETPGPPVSLLCGAKDSAGYPCLARGIRNRERARCGCT
jgi:hypothetical protein